MTKEEIKKEIEAMKEHLEGVKEDIEIKTTRILKDKDKLDYWDFYYLSNCYSDLNIITIKLKIIEEILKLF